MKAIHVIAVIVMLGNILTGLFWKAQADRSGNRDVIASTLRGIQRSDRIFTIPGIIVIVAAGFAAANVGGIPILSTGWILWSLILFVISGLAFIPVTRRQAEMSALADAGAATGTLDQALYRRLSRSWEMWGLLALILPFIAVVLMVVKPALPALHR